MDCPSSVEEFAKECGLEDFSITDTCLGEVLAGRVTRHPLLTEPVRWYRRICDHGYRNWFVHIAPGHGLDDYLTGLEHGLEIYCPLDDGKYLMTVRFPKT